MAARLLDLTLGLAAPRVSNLASGQSVHSGQNVPSGQFMPSGQSMPSGQRLPLSQTLAWGPTQNTPDEWQLADRGMTDAFLSHGRETPRFLEEMIKARPEHPRAHAARALMLTSLARVELRANAVAAALEAERLAEAYGAPERALAAAARAATQGSWWNAIHHLEEVLRLDRTDSLAAKFCHSLRFMLGDKIGMLKSMERVLARLPQGHPDRGYLMGCHAFALEENGFAAQAEPIGREGVRLNPRDAWGIHAVSHVHEMMGRAEEGIEWIEGAKENLAHCNNFATHFFWHKGLFYLEKGDVGKVFAIYDEEVRREKTDDFRDIANAASLLMRLEVDGHSVGDRWEELADKAEARLSDRSYVFADLHYLFALLGAGRSEAARQLAASLAGGNAGYSSQNLVARKVGGAMAEGIIHFAEGRPELAVKAMRHVSVQSVMIGGSDAQRDVFAQILLESALRSGDESMAQSLIYDRLVARAGRNRFAAERLARLSRQSTKKSGRLTVLAALAFPPAMAPTGHA